MTITLPLTLFQLIVVVFLAIPSMCVIATLTSERFYNRRFRQGMRRRERDLKLERNQLNTDAELLEARDTAVTDREEAVAWREQHLRREAKETGARISRTAEGFDTMISVMDVDDFPHPFENAATIEMPAVRDE